MSLDPILRFFGTDFPVFSRAMHQQVDRWSWAGQIAVPAYAELYALSEGDLAGVGILAGALLINQMALEAMKRLIPANRPNGRPGSFPSGHTAAAFVGAAFLAFRYDAALIPLTIAFLGATGVGVSRVVLRAHWVHDVVGGALLGTSLAYGIAKKRSPID